MLTNNQIFSALNSISTALEVINHESFTAHKFVNHFEKDTMRGESYLQGFRLNMIERIRIFEGLVDCISILIKDTLDAKGDVQEEKGEVKQCVGL